MSSEDAYYDDEFEDTDSEEERFKAPPPPVRASRPQSATKRPPVPPVKPRMTGNMRAPESAESNEDSSTYSSSRSTPRTKDGSQRSTPRGPTSPATSGRPVVKPTVSPRHVSSTSEAAQPVIPAKPATPASQRSYEDDFESQSPTTPAPVSKPEQGGNQSPRTHSNASTPRKPSSPPKSQHSTPRGSFSGRKATPTGTPRSARDSTVGSPARPSGSVDEADGSLSDKKKRKLEKQRQLQVEAQQLGNRQAQSDLIQTEMTERHKIGEKEAADRKHDIQEERKSRAASTDREKSRKDKEVQQQQEVDKRRQDEDRRRKVEAENEARRQREEDLARAEMKEREAQRARDVDHSEGRRRDVPSGDKESSASRSQPRRDRENALVKTSAAVDSDNAEIYLSCVDCIEVPSSKSLSVKAAIREKHVGLYHAGNFMVIGGVANKIPDAGIDAFDLQSKVWRHLKTLGDRPDALVGHTATLHDGALIVVGGHKATGPLAAVFTLNLSTMKWRCEENSKDNDMFPSGRNPNISRFHSAAIYKSHCFIFGGVKESGVRSNDLDVLNLQTMKWASTEDHLDQLNAPSPVSHHSAVLFNHKMYLFGGKTNPFGDPTNGLFAFDLAIHQFSDDLMPQCGGAHPAPRAGHASTLFGSTMFVSSGSTGHSLFAEDLWSLNLGTMTWQMIECSSKIPGRQFHSMTVVGQGSEKSLLLYGGGGFHCGTSTYAQVAYTATNTMHLIPLRESDEEPYDETAHQRREESVVRAVRRRPQTATVERSAQPNAATTDENEGDVDAVEAAKIVKRLRRFNHWNLDNRFEMLGPRTAVGRGDVKPLDEKQLTTMVNRLAVSHRADEVKRLQRKLESQQRPQSASRPDAKTDEQKKKVVPEEIAKRMYNADVEYRQKKREALLRKHLPDPAKDPNRKVRSDQQIVELAAEMYNRHLQAQRNARSKLVKKYAAPPPQRHTTDIAAANERLYKSAVSHHEATKQKLAKKYLAEPEKRFVEGPELEEMLARLVPDKAVVPARKQR